MYEKNLLETSDINSNYGICLFHLVYKNFFNKSDANKTANELPVLPPPSVVVVVVVVVVEVPTVGIFVVSSSSKKLFKATKFFLCQSMITFEEVL
jgi:hypothetical protein